jgi:hypothetical protein
VRGCAAKRRVRGKGKQGGGGRAQRRRAKRRLAGAAGCKGDELLTHKVVGAAIGTNSLAAVCANVCNLRCKGSARRLKAHTLFRFIAVPVARALEKIEVRRGEGREEGEIKKKRGWGVEGKHRNKGVKAMRKMLILRTWLGHAAFATAKMARKKRDSIGDYRKKSIGGSKGIFCLVGS